MARQKRSNRSAGKPVKRRHNGEPSVYTCPDCQGTLFLDRQGGLIRFRCRIGHIYSPESMMEAQDENVERLMWSATRALEEQAEYVDQIAGQIAKSEDSGQMKQYSIKAQSSRHKADQMRKLLTERDGSLAGVVGMGSRRR